MINLFPSDGYIEIFVEISQAFSFPPLAERARSVKASAAVNAWCPEAKPLAAGFGDGSGVPNIPKTG